MVSQNQNWIWVLTERFLLSEFYGQSKSKKGLQFWFWRFWSSSRVKIEAPIFTRKLDQNWKVKSTMWEFSLSSCFCFEFHGMFFPMRGRTLFNFDFDFDKTRSVKIKNGEILDKSDINICPKYRTWTFSILILTDHIRHRDSV